MPQVSETSAQISGAVAQVYDWNPDIVGLPVIGVGQGRDGLFQVVGMSLL